MTDTTTTDAAAATPPLLGGLPLLATRLAAFGLVGESALGVAGLVFGGVLEFAAAVLADEEFIFERHEFRFR